MLFSMFSYNDKQGTLGPQLLFRTHEFPSLSLSLLHTIKNNTPASTNNYTCIWFMVKLHKGVTIKPRASIFNKYVSIYIDKLVQISNKLCIGFNKFICFILPLYLYIAIFEVFLRGQILIVILIPL